MIREKKFQFSICTTSLLSLLVASSVMVLFVQGAQAESLELDGTSGIYAVPVSYDSTNKTITDRNNYTFKVQSDGLYRVTDDNGHSTFFGFGLTGVYQGTAVRKMTTDYQQTSQISSITGGYKVSIKTTDYDVIFTNATFTDVQTKIAIELKNPYPNPITNVTYWFLFTLQDGDTVRYGSNFITVDNTTNATFISEQTRAIINQRINFNFSDLLFSGANISELRIVNASNLGFNHSDTVMAVGVTSGNRTMLSGITYELDPSLEQSGGSVTLNGTQNYDYVNLSNGAILYVTAYNGTSPSGTLILNVTYDVNIDNTSSIIGDGRGYSGGAGGSSGGGDVAAKGGSAGGNSSAGAGVQGECGATYGYSGAGGAGGGGYGGWGQKGGNGVYFSGGSTGVGGVGGGTIGTADGNDITMGSGAGGGGGACGGTSGGTGGVGGAMLTINNARNVTINGTISFNGSAGGTGGSGTYNGGSGSGASGGGIMFNNITSLNISSAKIFAVGGTGGTGGAAGGGTGGGGRVKFRSVLSLTNMSTTIAVGNGTISYGTISDVNSTYWINAGATLTIDANVTSGSPTFTTNATKGSINSATGVFTYTPVLADAGTYVWNITATSGETVFTTNFIVNVSGYRVDSALADGARPVQKSLNISNSTGTNNATHMFCNGNCNVNFTDIRFILDNTTPLSYWVDGSSGRAWVNITANGTVNLFYGNAGATTTRNSSAVLWQNSSDFTTTGQANSSGDYAASPAGNKAGAFDNILTSNQNLNYQWFSADLISNTNGRVWIGQDFTTSKMVSSYNIEVDVVAATSMTSDRVPYNWTFQGSNNGFTTYTVLDTQTKKVLGDSVWYNVSLSSPQQFSYYRVNITRAYGTGGDGLNVSFAFVTELEMLEYKEEGVWSTWSAQSNPTPAPSITSWSNNVTSNNTLTPRINVSTGINFEATADQTIDTWSWFKDTVNQSNNFDNFSTSWDTLGAKNITVTAYNSNGVSAAKTWTVTVSDITVPWLVNETMLYSAVAQNANNTVSANFTDDTNISSAIVRIQAPNLTEANYTMTCNPALNTSTCTYTDTDTSSTGTYTITRYWVTDGSSNTANISSSASFIVSTAPIITDRQNSITNNNTLYDIRANISVSIRFNISAGGVTSYQWYKDGTLQVGQELELFTTSWDTLGNKNITATAKNQWGTSLPTTWSVNITDITASWFVTSSVTSERLFVQAYPVTINVEFGDDTNVSSAIVRVQHPDTSEANYTMTCTGTSAANCSYVYTTTATIGGYNILFFYPVDGSANQRNITANLGFTTTAPPEGGGGGGEPPPSGTPSRGTSGGAPPRAEETPITTQVPMEITFRDITEGATEPQAIDIAGCLTDSLLMSNKCSGYNYGVVVEPVNWWVAVGAYLAAFGVVLIQTVRHDIRRSFLQETLLYGTMTVALTAILVSVGFNAYILNYLLDSPKYFLTFLNFAAFGVVVAIIGDNYYYRKNRKRYKLKPEAHII